MIHMCTHNTLPKYSTHALVEHHHPPVSPSPAGEIDSSAAEADGDDDLVPNSRSQTESVWTYYGLVWHSSTSLVKLFF